MENSLYVAAKGVMICYGLFSTVKVYSYTNGNFI